MANKGLFLVVDDSGVRGVLPRPSFNPLAVGLEGVRGTSDVVRRASKVMYVSAEGEVTVLKDRAGAQSHGGSRAVQERARVHLKAVEDLVSHGFGRAGEVVGGNLVFVSEQALSDLELAGLLVTVDSGVFGTRADRAVLLGTTHGGVYQLVRVQALAGLAGVEVAWERRG